ncbi:zinc ABC transporter substrate-binding protein [Aestuariivirga sp.]|uniref:zinc ABC transporter substrate-binding protein n=1 Tax=Aestuariivirga sp. TaxID=2650926 RepID=UPI00391D1167
MRRFLVPLALLLASAPAVAQPKVVASVIPVHGIVSAVMGDKGQPELLLAGSMPEHRASFSPQQIKELGEADLVFIIGQGLEAKLSQMSGTEAVNGRRFVELAAAPGVTTLPVRQGGTWETHDHAHEEEHGHEEGEGHDEGVLAFDPHVWLDPANAKAMALAVAQELAKADPGNAALYLRNAEDFARSVDETAEAIEAELEGVKTTPYVVFHDAYQYFERRFGLAAAGSISDVSAAAPSAQRLREIRRKITEVKAACVFREPQYDNKVVATVVEGTAAREGVLDPIGADVAPGPLAYQQILRNLAASLRQCLAG